MAWQHKNVSQKSPVCKSPWRHYFQYHNVILFPKLFWPTVRKNCNSDPEKIVKFETESLEFAKVLRSLQLSIQTLLCKLFYILTGHQMFKLVSKFDCLFTFLLCQKKNKSLWNIFIAMTKPFLFLDGALKLISQEQF